MRKADVHPTAAVVAHKKLKKKWFGKNEEKTLHSIFTHGLWHCFHRRRDINMQVVVAAAAVGLAGFLAS